MIGCGQLIEDVSVGQVRASRAGKRWRKPLALCYLPAAPQVVGPNDVKVDNPPVLFVFEVGVTVAPPPPPAQDRSVPRLHRPSLPRPLKSYTRRRREFLATPAKEREVRQRGQASTNRLPGLIRPRRAFL